MLHNPGFGIFEAASRGGSGCGGERWLRSKLSQLGCDVSCFRKLIHTPYRPECRVGIREPSDETPERPTRSLRGTRERERTRLRLVNFLRWSSHPTAIGRYMKACRAPSTCHKATEENLSRIDTLAWSYPKVRIVDPWVVNPLLSFETGASFLIWRVGSRGAMTGRHMSRILSLSNATFFKPRRQVLKGRELLEMAASLPQTRGVWNVLRLNSDRGGDATAVNGALRSSFCGPLMWVALPFIFNAAINRCHHCHVCENCHVCVNYHFHSCST